MPSWSGIARRIRVPVGFVFAAVYLWLARPTWSAIVIGAVIVAAGLWLRALASGHVKKDSELTTTGPYAYTRNPLYLGSVIIAVGFLIASRNVWLVLGAALIFLLLYLPVIGAEETSLRSRFPEFDQYAAGVRRFWPGFLIRPGFMMSKPEKFSRELYLQHREYNAALGAAAMIVALAAKLWWLAR